LNGLIRMIYMANYNKISKAYNLQQMKSMNGLYSELQAKIKSVK